MSNDPAEVPMSKLKILLRTKGEEVAIKLLTISDLWEGDVPVGEHSNHQLSILLC